MKKLMIAISSLLLMVFQCCITTAGEKSGNFDWPVYPISQYNNALKFLDKNNDLQIPKYHLGEDWNSNDGFDYGDPVYSIANGTVIFIDSGNSQSSKKSIGKIIIIRHTLSTGKQIDSVYYHLKDILVSLNEDVIKGKQIGTIGDAEGYWPSHLHFEIRADLNLDKQGNPYIVPLYIQIALKYLNPSLFIDDRKYQYTDSLILNSWKYFNLYFNAPSSTAYVEYNNEKYSLKKAVDSGLIYKYVYVKINGLWYYYPNILNVFFEPNNTYAIYSFVNGVNLNILIPGNNFKDGRAKQDMINAAKYDNRFTDAMTEKYFENLNWSTNWELRGMPFNYTSVNGSGYAYFNQVTSKSNPLIRYTSFYDPELKQWTNWIKIDPNKLE